MPKLLHQSEGLTISENDLNGFTVVTLHYSADPAKRNDQWKREARFGLTPAQFAQEYEIEYDAIFGERVWPQFSEHRDKIVVSPPYPEVPLGTPCWAGFDYGIRNPSSFHVYTYLDGCFYSVWELFEPCRNIIEFSDKLKACPYWPQLRWIAADSSIWSETQRRSDGSVTSNFELFTQQGITKLLRGSKDEQAFITLLNKHWQHLEAQPPTFRIFSCCVNQIREFEAAIYQSMSEKTQQSRNYQEALVDKDNHSIDDCRYFFLSNPSVTTTLHIGKPVDAWRRYRR